MLPVRCYTSTEEYISLANAVKENPHAHLIFPRGFRMLYPRMLGFITRMASFYIEPPQPPFATETTPLKFNVALDADFKEIVGSVTLDNLHRATIHGKVSFVAVARHVSNGPHSTLPRLNGWFFHCLMLEKAFEEEGRGALGPYSDMVYRKVAVMFDVDCEHWERAKPTLEIVMLI